MTDDLAARIAALVDDQLEQVPTGYDYSVGQERCRCGDEWHGLPVTQAMRRMRGLYSMGHTDVMDGYTTDTDTSPIMCPGSDVQGPLRATLSAGRFGEIMDQVDADVREMARDVRIPQQRYSQNSIDWLTRIREDDPQAGMFTHRPWMDGPHIEEGQPVAFEDIHTGELHTYRWGERERIITAGDQLRMIEQVNAMMEQLDL